MDLCGCVDPYLGISWEMVNSTRLEHIICVDQTLTPKSCLCWGSSLSAATLFEDPLPPRGIVRSRFLSGSSWLIQSSDQSCRSQNYPKSQKTSLYERPHAVFGCPFLFGLPPKDNATFRFLVWGFLLKQHKPGFENVQGFCYVLLHSGKLVKGSLWFPPNRCRNSHPTSWSSGSSGGQVWQTIILSW